MHVATIAAHFNDKRRVPRALRGTRRSFYDTYALGSARRPPVREKAPAYFWIVDNFMQDLSKNASICAIF